MITSFFLDEGCIKDKIVSFVSGNKVLLDGIRNICIGLKYDTSVVRETNRLYDFKLRAGNLDKFYRDINRFGKIPHKDKRIKLKHGINLTNNKWNRLKLELPILNLLKTKNRTSLELAHSLGVRSNTISIYLIKLRARGLVEGFGKQPGKGGAILWGLSPS